MAENPLDIAISAIQDELDSFDSSEYEEKGSEFGEGYAQALRDTIENLRMLQRSLG